MQTRLSVFCSLKYLLLVNVSFTYASILTKKFKKQLNLVNAVKIENFVHYRHWYNCFFIITYIFSTIMLAILIVSISIIIVITRIVRIKIFFICSISQTLFIIYYEYIYLIYIIKFLSKLIYDKKINEVK